MADTNNINPDTDNIIPDGLRADVMRNKMENKEALRNPGDIYIGTGQTTEITVGDKIYKIPKTIGKNLKDAILEFGQIDSYPLSDALKPISISSKNDLVNPKDGTLKELAKRSFAYTVSDSPVKLQGADAANNKEEVIIPAWSKGMVLSNGDDLLVTYGNENISGVFFYNQSKPKWTTVKANIANILDSETMKTTNDGLIPKTTESVNLGSGSNLFNTVYAKYFSVPGTCFNFRYDNNEAEEDKITSVRFGFEYRRPDGNTVPIKSHLFMDGSGEDGEGHLTWIKAKGLAPYQSNEINFNLESDSNNLIFGASNSTKTISRYEFKNGKNNTFSPIVRGSVALNAGVDTSTTYDFTVGGSDITLDSIAIPAWSKGVCVSSGNDASIWCTNKDVTKFLFYNISEPKWHLSSIEAPSFNATSDKRLKENIIPFTSEKSILDLPVYTFNFKSDKNKKKHVGCLAQDLQEICPDLVNEDSQGYLSIEESKITYLLLEEVKELKKQVEELKGKINELEGK